VDMKILITGGCGFIGRHVAAEFIDAGYTVRVLDSLVDQVHGEQASAMPEGVECIVGDVRDKAYVRRALEGIDKVVHLAAEVGVGQSMYEIARYVGANDLGTAVLLEEMIDRPVDTIVVASSMSVYGEGLYRDANGRIHDRVRRKAATAGPGRWNPLDADGRPLTPVRTDEEKPVDLSSIYALTKYMQERAVVLFGEAYKRRTVALRLFNVFGPGQALSNPYTGVLANFGSRLANGEKPIVFEDGEQRRDFVHVRDVALAFRLALEKAERADGHTFNVGSGHSYAIGDVAERLAEAMGKPDLKPDVVGKVRSGDIRNCFADTSKATEILGFAPRYLLEHSMPELAAWASGTSSVDRGAEMRRQLERRGLVS
jgi:dTDP-L-rhamnose 4-epimerase